jgi:hypothetical protein
MALPEIVIPITANADGVKTGVGVAVGQLEKLDGVTDRLAGGLQRVGDRFTRMGKNLSYVSAGLAAAAGAALLMTKNIADMGDKIANSSKAAGVSTDYFQEMAFAVGQVADVTEDEFADSLVKLTRKLGEAKEGSASAISVFEKMGITQEQIASGSIGTEEAMNAFLATMGQTASQADAAALATDLFGKSGARMGGLLAGSTGEIAGLRDRARELGIVMSGEAVAASEKFGDQWEMVGKSVQGLQVKIAEALLPVIVDTLIPALLNDVIPALASVAEYIGDVIRWFGDLPAPIQEAASVIALAFAAGGPALLAIGTFSTVIGALIAATGPVGLFIAAAALLGAAWQVWGDDFKLFVGSAVDSVTEKFHAFLGRLQEIVDWAGRVKTAVADAFSIGRDAMNSGDGYQGMGGAMGGEAEMFGGGGGGGSQSTGRALADGLTLGVTDGLAANAAALGAAFMAVTEQANTAFDVHSPSRVFHDIGLNIGQGLANGISAAGSVVSQAVDGIAGAATGTTAGMVSDILGSMSTLFKGSKAFAIGQAIISMWQGAAEALKLPFPANIAAFAKVAATGATALSNIKSAQPGGGGAGGSAASGGAVAAPAQVTQVANITWVGAPTASGMTSLTERLNAEFKQGYVLNLNFAGN